MPLSYRPRDEIARDLMVHDRTSLIKEAVSIALFVAMVFTLASAQTSITKVYGDANASLQATDGAHVVFGTNGTYILNPSNPLIWNASEITFDKDILARMTPWESLIVALLETGMAVTIGAEVVKTSAYIWKELRPRAWLMSAMWAFGARRFWILDAFTSGKALVAATGYAAGILIGRYALLPYVRSQVSGTFANIFLSNEPGPMPFAAASLVPLAGFGLLSASVLRMLRTKNLRNASLEFQ